MSAATTPTPITISDAAAEFLADRILQRFLDAASAKPALVAKTQKAVAK